VRGITGGAPASSDDLIRHREEPLPRLILMCGLPGSGKTTRAKRLAAELPAVRLCPDEWLADLGVDLFDERTRERFEVEFWRHAQELLALGQSVILESGFWLRSDRDEKRLGARALGVPVELRYLAVPLDELCRRVEHRDTPGTVPLTREQIEEYVTMFQPPDDAELAMFDQPEDADVLAHVHGVPVLVCAADGPRLADSDSARDLILAAGRSGADWACVPVARVADEFFSLRTGVAGEVVQKFVNYRLRLAIVGDIAQYVAASSAFDGFVDESNRGRQLWFVPTMAAFEEKLKARG
jgi:predicted kinase